MGVLVWLILKCLVLFPCITESGIEGIDTIVADVHDQTSLEAMCSKALILINCVGPVRVFVVQ